MPAEHFKTARHLRINDQHGRAEQFTAHDAASFAIALSEAMERYRQALVATVPFWLARRRQALRASPPLLQLHVLDTWATEREGLTVWLPVHLENGASPVISPQTASRGNAADLWACIESASAQAEQMARYFGYHPDGQNRLRDFLNTCLDR